jgi:hypothetical protein
MVMAPAKTGVAMTCSQEVTNQLHEKRVILWKPRPGARMFKMVMMKFRPPVMELVPKRWTPKIQKSTPRPGEY